MSFLGTGACLLLVRSQPAIAQAVQALPYVNLQSTTPGVQQTGHINVSGKTKSGQLEGSGQGITNLDAGNLASGLVADARLSGNVPRLNATNTFSGVNNLTNASNSFTGDGQLLTNLNASRLATGTVPDARLTIGGDLVGPLGTAKVDGLQGVPISSTAPGEEHVLKFFAGSWRPGLDETFRLPYSGANNNVQTAFSVTNTVADAISAFTTDGNALYGQAGSNGLISDGYGVAGISNVANGAGVRGHGAGSAVPGGYFMNTPSNRYVEVAGPIRCMTMSGFLYRETVADTFKAVVPIAYGVVNSTGGILSGTGNFTVTKAGTGLYDITVTGESYSNTVHTVVVTAVSSSARFGTVTDAGVECRVNMWSTAGAAVDNQFQFTIFGNPASGG